MPKYRPFTTEELEGLEDDFARYLVINGITSEDWLRIKTENSHTAEEILDTYSDVVWESMLRRAQYIDLYERQVITTYHCAERHISMVGLMTEDTTYDFTTAASIARAQIAPPSDLQYISGHRPYTDIREAEIYALIQRGGQISDGRLYESITVLQRG